MTNTQNSTQSLSTGSTFASMMRRASGSGPILSEILSEAGSMRGDRAEVARAFARASHRRGENSTGSFYFTAERGVGLILWSYGRHFPVALRPVLGDRARGGQAPDELTNLVFVAHTEASPSVTTSHHIGACLSALAFEGLPTVSLWSFYGLTGHSLSNVGTHRLNIQNKLREIQELEERHARARKYDYREDIRRAEAEALAYLAWYGEDARESLRGAWGADRLERLSAHMWTPSDRA